jgi:hypothetical protein
MLFVAAIRCSHGGEWNTGRGGRRTVFVSSLAINGTANVIQTADAQRHAVAAGGRLVNLMQRTPQGLGQKCPWDLAVCVGTAPLDRAAAVWVVADEIMQYRTGLDTRTYGIWRDAALSGRPVNDTEWKYVRPFAQPVFGTKNTAHHGVAGYLSEWLWYLLTRDLPPEVGRTVELLEAPGPTVNDSGGDGLVLHRTPGGTTAFTLRLWEMKKYTAVADDVHPTIRGAWQQINEEGARYLGQVPWADKALSSDTSSFLAGIVRQWVDGTPSTNGGVSVALNPSSAPARAFHLSHEHFITHSHPGALEGLVVVVDDLERFAGEVRRLVWNAP